MSPDDHNVDQHQRSAMNQAVSVSDEQPDPILDRITRLASRTTGAPVSLISLIDGERFRITSATGSPELLHPQTAIPRSQSLCERVVQQQQPLAVPDTERSGLAENCRLVERTDMRSFLGVPLTLAGNVTIGTLSVADTSPRNWSQGDIAALTDLAALLVEEIERRQHADTLDPAEALADRKHRQKERLLDAIGEGVYVVDTSGVCQFINRAGANILGYEPEQVLGQRMHELVHDRYPDGRPMPREECTIVQALLSGEALHLSEHVLWRRDGTPVHVELTASPVSELGEITGTVVRFSDLSEYARQQEKLRESEVRKSAMFEAALDCIITIDHEGRIVEFNAAAERTFGYVREFAMGRLMADLILPPEYRDSCLHAFANHLETGKSTVIGDRIERPAMRSDGSIIQTEMAVTRIDLPDREQPLFTAYLRDITERQEAEEALRIHKHMVDAVGQVVIANDNSPQRRITYWNRAAEQILGWTANEAIGQEFYDVVPAPEFHDDVRAIGQRVRAGENWQGEFQLQHRDGTIIPAIASVAPILNDEGELLGVISAYTDVTEIKEAEREIRLYKHVVDAIGESVVASDMDRRIFYANRAAEEALGWSIDDVRGLDVRDVVPDTDYRERSTAIGKEVRETGQRVTREFILRHTGGNTFPALVTISPISGDHDELVGTIGIYTDISELKETERELRFHKHAIDAVGQAIIANDLDRNITYWNDAAEELLGWKAEQVLGKPFFELIPADSVIDQVHQIGMHAREGTTWRGEFLFKHRDGHLIPTLSSVRPVIDADGEIIGILGAHTDLTEIKETDREVRLYKHLTDAVGQALVANNLDRGITYWNKAAEHVFGWNADEVLGEDFYQLTCPDEVIDEMSVIGARVRGGESWSGEFKLKRKDGKSIPVLMSVSPVFDEDGNPVQIIGAYTDISELKRTEADIQFFKHVVDAIGEAVIATSIAGDITYVNSSAERMLGWSADELIGKPLLSTIPNQSLLEQARELAAYVRTGTSWTGEFPLQRKDGTTFPAIISLAPVTDETGQTTGIISVYTEISNLKHAEEENRFFKHVVDAVGQVVIANDLDRNITYWNQAAEEILGWEPEEVVGIDAATVAPTPDFLGTIPEITAIVRSGGTWVGEFPLQHRDGTVIPALTTLRPIYNEAEEIIGVLGAHTDIRELKRTEQDLRFHKYIVDAVGQAVVVCDHSGRVTYWNKGAERTYGWTNQEALGQAAYNLLPVEAERDTFGQISARVLQGDRWFGESTVMHRDGRSFPAYVTLSPVYDSNESIVGVIGVSHDISDQKEYERQIEFHKIMLDAVGQTIVTTDLDRVITYWSKGAEHALGWHADEVLGRPIADIAPAAHLKDEAGKLHQNVRQGESWTGEFPIRRKDGSTFPAVVNLAPVTLADQGTVGVIGVYTDISELKQTEDELRLHKHMLDAAGQAVFATDGQLRITYVNHATEELYGYRAAEVIGKNFLDFLPAESSSYELAVNAIDVVSREGAWTGEMVTYNSTGSEISVLVSATPILGEGNHQVGLIIAMADITARRRVEQALQESNEQITDILETMGEGFITLDQSWKMRYVNRQAELILQRNRDDLVGNDFWDEFPESGDEPFYRRFVEAFETGKAVEVTAYDPYLDMWLEAHASPSNGQLSVFFRDVTERRKREVALREAEERYRTLVEQLPAVTYIAAADNPGDLLYVSPQLERMLGFTPDEWLRNDEFWTGQLHPEDHDFVLEHDAETVRSRREHYTLEYRLMAADGNYHWLRDSATLIHDIDGNPSYWQGLSYDITEEKRAERTIRESEQRFRSLFDNHPDAVFSIDDRGRVLSANPAFETMTGYSSRQMEILHFVDLVTPDDQERVRDRFAETHKGRAQDFRAGILDPDGDRIELNLTTIPIIVEEDIVGVHVVAQDVTIHQELENQLAHQAYHDALTGLPNRNLFQNRLDERLEIARNNEDQFAVLFFDLDDFKVINDSLGHSAGDQLLVEVTGRVQTCIRSDDLLARLGGDEFTLLLEQVIDDQDAIIIAERVAAVLDEPFNVDGHEVFATTSIGIALGDASSPDSDAILRNADLSMYEAKNSGKNRYALFDPSMNSRAWTRLMLETEIRRGIPRGEFVVHYQPIVDLNSGELEGVEALVRWNHPERGLLTPGDFISIAEQSGLILPLGRWIIREASEQLCEWQELTPDGRPIRLSLNLSPKQYQHPRLIEELTHSLATVNLDPRLITLEITENIAMDDSSDTMDTLQELKDLGVQLALDDFGTGFSALSYLRRFPIDIVKIDQSFVDGLGRDPEDTNIVQAVMAASLAMKLRVTAEGIETAEQLTMLRELGCHYGQGYLFARALTATDMSRIIQSAERPWKSLMYSSTSEEAPGTRT